jgi:hypothetical protein
VSPVGILLYVGFSPFKRDGAGCDIDMRLLKHGGGYVVGGNERGEQRLGHRKLTFCILLGLHAASCVTFFVCQTKLEWGARHLSHFLRLARMSGDPGSF